MSCAHRILAMIQEQKRKKSEINACDEPSW